MSIWLALALALSVAQAPAPAKKIADTAHLVLTTSVAIGASSPGKVSLHVDVAPKPSMRVYAPGQEGYLAIALALEADGSFDAAKPKYPAGEKLFMPLLRETQLVYAKPFRITQEVAIRRGAPRPRVIKGTLRYQACDDKVCYLPKSVPIEWPIDAAPGAGR